MKIKNEIGQVNTLIQGETVNVGGIAVNSETSPTQFLAAVGLLRDEIRRLPLEDHTKEAVVEELRMAEEASSTNGKDVQGLLERAKAILVTVGGTVGAVTSVIEKLAGLAAIAAQIF